MIEILYLFACDPSVGLDEILEVLVVQAEHVVDSFLDQ